jgi:hypothetical protein
MDCIAVLATRDIVSHYCGFECSSVALCNCYARQPRVSPSLAYVNIDIEIDIAHAGLRRLMRAAFMPAAGAWARPADIGELQASPLRQRPRALAAELPGQHDLFAAFIGADDVRAQFADATVIEADDLLLAEDGVAEEGVGGAWHCRSVQARLLSGVA